VSDPGKEHAPRQGHNISHVKRRRWLPPTLAAVGAILVIGIELAASVPGSPLAETVPGLEAADALEGLAMKLRLPFAPEALMTTGLVFLGLAAVSFVVAARLAWRGFISLRFAIAIAILLHLLSLPAPILFSRDVYSYVMYGRIVSEHGANPYVSVPKDFPEDRLVRHIGYQDETSVYGPVFTTLSAATTAVFPSVAASVWTLKLIAILSSLGAMQLVVMAARRTRPERAAFAAVLIGWNPVVIFHAVGGAHNDILVMLSLAAGGLLVLSYRFRAATLCLVVGALIKAIVLLPLVLLVVGAVALATRGRRLTVLLGHLTVATVAFLLFAAPFLQTENPTLGLLSASERFGAGSGAVRSIAQATGLGSVGEPLARLAQGIAPLVVLAATVMVALHLLRRGAAADPTTIVGGMGWVLLLTFLLFDQHFPWYGMWTLPFAWILPRAARSGVLLTSVALTMVHPWSIISGIDRWIVWAFYGSLVIIGLVLLRVTMDLGLRVVPKKTQGDSGALMDEASRPLPALFAPLVWLDAVAPGFPRAPGELR